MLRILLSLALMSAFFGMAQTTLPTSFDFETAPTTVPLGWTTNTSDFYSTGVSGKAGKLNQTGNYFTINTSDEPGELTYYLRGFISTGSWQGTFTVEESVDGSTWSTIRQFNDGDINSNAYVLYTDTVDRNSRYVSFFFTNKVSGSNVGIDDVMLKVAPPSNEAEIHCTYFSNDVIDMGSIDFSTPVFPDTLDINVSVHNLGLQDSLVLSNLNFTGAAALSYSVLSYDTTINALDSGTITIRFIPIQSGLNDADLVIANTDLNENPYTIHLLGVGGGLYNEPASQPTSMSFSGVKSYELDVSFTAAASSPDGYIVLRSENSAVSGVPVDGQWYSLGDPIGVSKVAYVGSATGFSPSAIRANIDYNFSVFSYNGFGQYVNYLTAVPLASSQMSSDNMMGNYYNGISTSSASFKEDLKTIIRAGYFQVYYSNYEYVMMADFYARDTADGQKVFNDTYSDKPMIYSEPLDWTTHGYSREHVYPRSWMPNPATGTDTQEGSDIHNLVPVHQDSTNEIRSNYPFGEVVNVTYQWGNAKYGTNSAGNVVYEPGDQSKGDAARALFYMCLMYDQHAQAGNYDWDIPTYVSNFIPYGQDQDMLKKWHWNDPPSNLEIARNDYLEQEQGNRNPFIDSVHFVCEFDFYTLDQVASTGTPCLTTPPTIGMAENEKHLNVVAFPNPVGDVLNLNISDFSVKTEITVLNSMGEMVYSSQTSSGKVSLNVESWNAGLYLIQIRDSGNSQTLRFIRE